MMNNINNIDNNKFNYNINKTNNNSPLSQPKKNIGFGYTPVGYPLKPFAHRDDNNENKILEKAINKLTSLVDSGKKNKVEHLNKDAKRLRENLETIVKIVDNRSTFGSTTGTRLSIMI